MPHEAQPQPADELDAEAVRTWSSLALAALGRARDDIDAINVYPVADADTGTNLYLTAESADRALTETFDNAARTGSGTAEVTGATEPTSLSEAVRAWAHGALVGARGNSGTILAQLLRGVADVLGAEPEDRRTGPGGLLAHALTRAAEEAYAAVAHPVEGTMLTVAGAAARAAEAASAAAGTAADVARAAYDGARAALAET
ncbi:DAK2 domain-containing protein, partial [Streptomyces sp. WAC05950]